MGLIGISFYNIGIHVANYDKKTFTTVKYLKTVKISKTWLKNIGTFPHYGEVYRYTGSKTYKYKNKEYNNNLKTIKMEIINSTTELRDKTKQLFSMLSSDDKDNVALAESIILDNASNKVDLDVHYIVENYVDCAFIIMGNLVENTNKAIYDFWKPYLDEVYDPSFVETFKEIPGLFEEQPSGN